MPDRLLNVRTGRHPHEVAVLGVTVFIGGVGAILPTSVSEAVVHVMDGWSRFYYAGLAFFAAVAITGIFRHKIEGMLVERFAISVVALYYAIFAACVLSFRGLGGLMSVALPLAYCGANLARCWQIRTDLALLKSYLRDHPGAEVR